MAEFRLTAELVAKMAARYLDMQNGSEGSIEQRLFAADGLHGDLRQQGYATLEQLVEIARWKSGPRTLHHFEGPEVGRDVETITRLAFSDGADGVRHRVLTLINGVSRPTASAILTIWRPNEFTVIDYRAVRTLLRAGELSSFLDAEDRADPWVAQKAMSYNVYVRVCLDLLGRLNKVGIETISLRDLDRALWQIDKESVG